MSKKTYHITSTSKDFAFFDSLFHEYYGILIAYAQKFVSDRQAAEDIVQDVFMSMWIKREEIDFTESINPYLYKAIYHKSLNYIQKNAHTKSLEMIATDILIYQEMDGYDIIDTLLYKEMMNEVKNCINTLPPSCKKIFILSRKEMLKNREVAEQLGISEKAIEKQISKALKLLREHLKKVGLMSLLFILYHFHQ